MKHRHSALPPNLEPRGLDRMEAAAYLGIGVTLFDRLVKDNTMPAAKRLAGRLVWDRRSLDKHFDAIPEERGTGAGSSWAGVGE